MLSKAGRTRETAGAFQIHSRKTRITRGRNVNDERVVARKTFDYVKNFHMKEKRFAHKINNLVTYDVN